MAKACESAVKWAFEVGKEELAEFYAERQRELEARRRTREPPAEAAQDSWFRWDFHAVWVGF